MTKFWTIGGFRCRRDDRGAGRGAGADRGAAGEARSSSRVNNSIFVFQHEIGHLFVGEFDLPVLGKEEDAADSLASVMLLSQDTEDVRPGAPRRRRRLVSHGVLARATNTRTPTSTTSTASIFSAPTPIVCLMVGANPKTFGDIAEEYEMDEDRQESCAFDYQQAVNSWVQLLEPHTVKDDKTGAAINVIYEAPIAEFAGHRRLPPPGAKFLEAGAQTSSRQLRAAARHEIRRQEMRRGERLLHTRTRRR